VQVFRNAQKIVERELQTVLSGVDDVAKKATGGNAAQAREAATALTALLTRAQHLQRRLREFNAEETQYVDRMEHRLAELNVLAKVCCTCVCLSVCVCVCMCVCV
jgi:hypothetical protein